MKNKLRFFAVLCAVVLCMTAFSVTAFAGGGDELPPEYEISDHTHTEETRHTNTQTASFDVVIHEDGSKTVTVGDKVWTIGNEPEQIGKVVNVNSYLHLRTGPSTDYTIIGHLLNGTEVEVLGESGGWYQIVIPEQTGYVYGKYLEVLNAAAKNGAENTELLTALLEIMLRNYGTAGSAASAPLTPDGNLMFSLRLVDEN